MCKTMGLMSQEIVFGLGFGGNATNFTAVQHIRNVFITELKPSKILPSPPLRKIYEFIKEKQTNLKIQI